MGGIIGVLVDPDYKSSSQIITDNVNNSNINTSAESLTHSAALINGLNTTLPLAMIKLSNLSTVVLNKYPVETLVYYTVTFLLVAFGIVKFGKRIVKGLVIFGMMCMVLNYSIIQLLTIAVESWINTQNKSSKLYLQVLPVINLLKEFWMWLIIDCFASWIFNILGYKLNLIIEDSNGQVLKLSDVRKRLANCQKFLSISNHVAYCDWFVIFLVAKALNLQEDALNTQFKETMIKFILKQELLKLPIVGWMMEASKFVGLARKGLGDLQKLKTSMQQFLSDKEGHWLHLFPEGTFQGRNQSTQDLKDPQHYLNVIKKSNEYAEKQGIKLDYTLCPRMTGFSSLLKGAKQAQLTLMQQQQQDQKEPMVQPTVAQKVAPFKMLDLSIAFYNNVTNFEGSSHANLDDRRRIPNAFDMFIGGEFNAIDVKLELIDDQVVGELIDKSCDQDGQTIDSDKFVCDWLLKQWVKKDIWLKQRANLLTLADEGKTKENNGDDEIVQLTHRISSLFFIFSQAIWFYPLLLILGVKLLPIIACSFLFLLSYLFTMIVIYCEV